MAKKSKEIHRMIWLLMANMDRADWWRGFSNWNHAISGVYRFPENGEPRRQGQNDYAYLLRALRQCGHCDHGESPWRVQERVVLPYSRASHHSWCCSWARLSVEEKGEITDWTDPDWRAPLRYREVLSLVWLSLFRRVSWYHRWRCRHSQYCQRGLQYRVSDLVLEVRVWMRTWCREFPSFWFQEGHWIDLDLQGFQEALILYRQ